MSYIGEGEISAIRRPLVDVEVAQVGRSVARFVAPGSLTGGRYGLFRWDMGPRAGGAAAHFHRTFSESFFVLSGVVRLYDGAAWAEAGPGDFLFVPEGGIHAFTNDSDDPASMLILFAPGAAREAYFKELADIIANRRALTREEWADLYERHDNHVLER